MSEVSISEQIATGFKSFKDDSCHGFFDWFCRSSSLVGKMKQLNSAVSAVVKANTASPNRKFDPDRTYVFYKNNCRGDGLLYDDFRICDMTDGHVIFNVCPKSADGVAEVYCESNGFEEPLISGTWKAVKAWFAA